MDNEIFGYVYSRFLDAKHTQRVELALNLYAFNDLADYIEETKCADVDFNCRRDIRNIYHEIYFRCEKDFFDTISCFVDHQANVIVSQMNQIVNSSVDPF